MDALISHIKRIQLTDDVEDIGDIINKIHLKITETENDNIKLLRNKEVLEWMFGQTTYLPFENQEKISKTKRAEEMKKLEDIWGLNIMKKLRPDLKNTGQWTQLFGETICKELYLLLGYKVSKPKKQEKYQPDLQTEEFILEVKSQTIFTSGTAAEKILGVPHKYADVPTLYSKPLKVVCIGGAERECIKFGCFPEVTNVSESKKRLLEFYKSMQIEFVQASLLLNSIIANANAN